MRDPAHGPQGESFESKLEVVELGADADGDEITSCVVAAEEGNPEGREKPKGRKKMSDAEMVREELVAAYDFLADGLPKEPGLDGRSSVLKVPTAKIREELRNRGFLDTDENGAISRKPGGSLAQMLAALCSFESWYFE